MTSETRSSQTTQLPLSAVGTILLGALISHLTHLTILRSPWCEEAKSRGEATFRFSHRPLQLSPALQSSLPRDQKHQRRNFQMSPSHSHSSLPIWSPKRGAETCHLQCTLFELLVCRIHKQNKPLSFRVVCYINSITWAITLIVPLSGEILDIYKHTRVYMSPLLSLLRQIEADYHTAMYRAFHKELVKQTVLYSQVCGRQARWSREETLWVKQLGTWLACGGW